MNIYSILQSKDKYDSYFPKLQSIAQRDSSNNKKYQNKPHQRLPVQSLNKSIDDSKYRMTYHDILRNPTPQRKMSRLQESRLQETTIRTFYRPNTIDIKKQSLKISDAIDGYEKLKELGKGGFAEVFQVRKEGVKLAMKKYALEQSFNCYKNECMIGNHFFEDGQIK